MLCHNFKQVYVYWYFDIAKYTICIFSNWFQNYALCIYAEYFLAEWKNATQSSKFSEKDNEFEYIFVIICKYIYEPCLKWTNILISNTKLTNYVLLKENNFCKTFKFRIKLGNLQIVYYDLLLSIYMIFVNTYLTSQKVWSVREHICFTFTVISMLLWK